MNIRYDIAHLWGCKTAICIIQETFCVFRTSLSSEIVYCILSPLFTPLTYVLKITGVKYKFVARKLWKG